LDFANSAKQRCWEPGYNTEEFDNFINWSHSSTSESTAVYARYVRAKAILYFPMSRRSSMSDGNEGAEGEKFGFYNERPNEERTLAGFLGSHKCVNFQSSPSIKGPL
jgi:hypothetical protein